MICGVREPNGSFFSLWCIQVSLLWQLFTSCPNGFTGNMKKGRLRGSAAGSTSRILWVRSMFLICSIQTRKIWLLWSCWLHRRHLREVEAVTICPVLLWFSTKDATFSCTFSICSLFYQNLDFVHIDFQAVWFGGVSVIVKDTRDLGVVGVNEHVVCHKVVVIIQYGPWIFSTWWC